MRRNRTKVITVHITEREIQALDRLVAEGFFISRSAAIRHAIRVLINKILLEKETADNFVKRYMFGENDDYFC